MTHMNKEVRKKVLEEYPPEYCQTLECVYGNGMMSEGCIEGIELLFQGINLKKVVALDFGCGLGAVAYYLAENYQAHVFGLDINPWMIDQCTANRPKHLESLLTFLESQTNHQLPFEDQTFDLIYSKGVLVHLDQKETLFKEIRRLLKPSGQLVICDWLSPNNSSWGERVQKLIDIEGLTLFPFTLRQYQELLHQAGFSNVTIRDDSQRYADFNKDIVKKLHQTEVQERLKQLQGPLSVQENITSYQSVADAFEHRELRAVNFVAQSDKLS